MGDNASTRFADGVLFSLAACLAAMLLLPPAALSQTCDRPVAEAVSVQGMVQALKAGTADDPRNWHPVRLKDAFCPGDTIRVGGRGRADLLLVNETLLRLDQHTTVRISAPEKGGLQLLDLFLGAFYFITRTPRTLNVTTPFVNAGVEGTEFLVKVENERTVLTVFEGRVLAANASGSLRVASGQSAVAEAGKAPVLQVVARPRDAVQWTLHYPSAFPPPRPGAEAGWEARVSSLLAVGRVEEARAAIEETLRTDPRNASAHALLATIAVARNDKDEALALAGKAVEADSRSAAARIALSYALQARFELAGARDSLREAVNAEPGNALAWARLAEMRLSFGELDEALKAAREAAGLSPDVARTQAVLGFAYLAQVRTRDASAAFEKAIALDQADPLPRLGLGLARIREGDLSGGRREIEIAASLDPQNSLIRSYLGKAYYEEKRDKPASSQLEMAKELDPADPTPFFYDAIRKQTLNRPVEALHDLQKSIERNDNRAVYRSRLLLDDDLAARSASLGRIYSDLGFQQLALVEGWKSVNTDPANHSAHRFLADSYSALPRHEIARVSELLQSQLLQPINIVPVQPQLAQGDLFILSGAGPSDPSFNEFNPLFNRDRLALQASGVAGSHRTVGDDLVFSGVQGNTSFSAGQFHFETDGFRTNNDQRHDIYSLFLQQSLSHRTSLQGEFRSADVRRGDLDLRFDPNNFDPTFRTSEDSGLGRIGIHHAFSSGNELIGTAVFRRLSTEDRFNPIPPIFVDIKQDQDGYGAEVQHLFRLGRAATMAGAGYFKVDREDTTMTVVSLPFPPGSQTFSEVLDRNIRHSNLYLYTHLHWPSRVTWTIGASADFVRDVKGDHNQFNPKAGITVTPLPGTTVRAAVVRVLTRTLPTSQTIEPTQVAGFNQFFDDEELAKSWRYGVALDQKFSPRIFGGVEVSRRDLKVPFDIVVVPAPPGTPFTEVRISDWKERQGRAYLNFAAHPWLALTAEYFYERFDRDPTLTVDFEHVRTHRVPLGASLHHPSGWGGRVQATRFDQEGGFIPLGSPLGTVVAGSDRFWLFDAALFYRLPARLGIVTVEGKNLFDRAFNFQDTDPVNPAIQPKRAVFLRVTLAI